MIFQTFAKTETSVLRFIAEVLRKYKLSEQVFADKKIINHLCLVGLEKNS